MRIGNHKAGRQPGGAGLARAHAAVTVGLIRWAGLLLVGLVALVFSIRRLGLPAQPAEQGGWLFQRFGSDGVNHGMIALTAAVALLGAVMTWRSWQARQSLGH